MREDEGGDDLAGQPAQVVVVPASGTACMSTHVLGPAPFPSQGRGLSASMLHGASWNTLDTPHQAGVMEVKTQGVGSAGGAALPCQLSLENQPMPNLGRSLGSTRQQI